MSKQKDIEDYINTIVGATVTTNALCTACKCTLPTILAFIKNNPHRFEKVKRGTYSIKGAAAISTTSSAAVSSDRPAHEW